MYVLQYLLSMSWHLSDFSEARTVIRDFKIPWNWAVTEKFAFYDARCFRDPSPTNRASLRMPSNFFVVF